MVWMKINFELSVLLMGLFGGCSYLCYRNRQLKQQVKKLNEEKKALEQCLHEAKQQMAKHGRLYAKLKENYSSLRKEEHRLIGDFQMKNEELKRQLLILMEKNKANGRLKNESLSLHSFKKKVH